MASVLFLDESGDHSLSKIDPQYPLFVLCGVILDEQYHNNSPRKSWTISSSAFSVGAR
jgi:hypothetical protein